VSTQAGSNRKQLGGVVCPPPGYELALSQAQRSRGIARKGRNVSKEACVRVVFVEDVRGAEALCVAGCVGVASLVISPPNKIVRHVGRVVGCDGLPSRRGVK
jgi:hypothetical protein